MSIRHDRFTVLGIVGIACIVFMWFNVLFLHQVFKWFPILIRIGPLYWLLPLSTLVLPMLPLFSARGRTRFWGVIAIVGVVTFFYSMWWIVRE
jgi:hypothetical protein